MLPSFIISIITGEAADAAHRARTSAIEYLVAAIFAICGLSFLVLAGYILAARHYGELASAVGFGAGFLAIAVGVLVYHRLKAKARSRRAKARLNQEAKTVAGAAAIAAIPAIIGKRGGVLGLVLPALAAAGYAIYRENMRKGPDGQDTDS